MSIDCTRVGQDALVSKSCRTGLDGGGGGIRTPETLSGLTVFKTAGFNHSPTPPFPSLTGNALAFQARKDGAPGQRIGIECLTHAPRFWAAEIKAKFPESNVYLPVILPVLPYSLQLRTAPPHVCLANFKVTGIIKIKTL